MDFVRNPYRCGPLRVGRYGMGETRTANGERHDGWGNDWKEKARNTKNKTARHEKLEKDNLQTS